MMMQAPPGRTASVDATRAAFTPATSERGTPAPHDSMLAVEATPLMVHDMQGLVSDLLKEASGPRMHTSGPSRTRSLLHGLLEAGRLAEGHLMLGMLRNAGVPCEVVTFNLLLTSYKKKGLWASVLHVVSEMSALGPPPDAISYNILIDTCGKAQELEHAFE